MTVLGIDASTARDSSIGLCFSDDEMMELLIRDKASQEQKLMTAIDGALTMLGHEIDDIEAIALGIGPGSFTGLRIALSVGRALAWAGNKQILGFSSLELMAESLPTEILSAGAYVIPVLDARMKKLYSAIFRLTDSGDLNRGSDDMDLPAEELIQRINELDAEQVLFAGNGLGKYQAVLAGVNAESVFYMPEASVSGLRLCELAQDKNRAIKLGLDEVFPLYLRKSEAENQLERKKKKGTN